MHVSYKQPIDACCIVIKTRIISLLTWHFRIRTGSWQIWDSLITMGQVNGATSTESGSYNVNGINVVKSTATVRKYYQCREKLESLRLILNQLLRDSKLLIHFLHSHPCSVDPRSGKNHLVGYLIFFFRVFPNTGSHWKQNTLLKGLQTACRLRCEEKTKNISAQISYRQFIRLNTLSV